MTRTGPRWNRLGAKFPRGKISIRAQAWALTAAHYKGLAMAVKLVMAAACLTVAVAPDPSTSWLSYAKFDAHGASPAPPGPTPPHLAHRTACGGWQASASRR